MSTTAPPPRRPKNGPTAFLLAAGLTFAAITAYGFWRAPIPAVNEPTYLGQARHVADPDFAPDDLFLRSSRPHFVYYTLVGPLVATAPFETTAAVFRLAGYALLAVGWVALVQAAVGRAALAPLAAVLWLACAAVGNFSGEWVVGGTESKAFAYGLGFLGLAACVAGRPLTTALCFGTAVSLHVIVGGWFVLASFASIPSRVIRRTSVVTLARAAASCGLFVVLAAPGLLPALHVLDGDGADVVHARFVHIFDRLGHHLDPMSFPATAWLGYAALIAGWIAVPRMTADAAARGRFDRVVIASVAFAVAGTVIGWRIGSAETMPLRDTRTWFMQFYPFRLADVLVPAATAVTAAAWLARQGRRFAVAASLAGIAVIAVAPAPDRDPSRYPPDVAADWRALCDWARTETDPDALFVTLPNSWAFKWYAGRAEYVSWKDCPQDAASIIEWERRWTVLRDWAADRYGPERSYDAADLADLRQRTDADYLLARRRGPMTTEPAYRNDTFRVYALPEPAETSPAASAAGE